MECEIPGGIPRIFPFVGHGDHVFIKEMSPVLIAALFTLFGWLGRAGIAIEPDLDDKLVKLFAPEQSCEGLTLDLSRVFAELFGEFDIKFGSFANAAFKNLAPLISRKIGGTGAAQTELQNRLRSAVDRQSISGAGLGSLML